MKSPLRKLREFTHTRNGSKDKQPAGHLEPAEELDDLRAGMQAVEDMRDQYDGLLAVAQSISGSAYDFSRSIQDMASYMLDTFGTIGDGECGNVFSMLGKVQYEISKLLDFYAAHVSQTIISPTENLLKELQSIEELKGQYEEKRQLYNQLRLQKPKGKGKKEKDIFDHQLITIKEKLNDQVMLLGLRFQSLKLGRELSLVTQAARHHTAQAHLFRKGLDSLNAVEPIVKQISEERKIDRTLSEGDVRTHMIADDLGADGEVLENDDEEESMPSTPLSFQPLPDEKSARAVKGAGGVMKNWESNSKSAPISPSMYFGTNKHESIQEFMLDRPIQKSVTTYALPSPADTSEGSNSQTATLTDKIEPPFSSEQAGTGGHAITTVAHEAKGLAGHGKTETDTRDGRQLFLPAESEHVVKQNKFFFPKAHLTSASFNHAFGVGPEGNVGPLPTVRYSHSGPIAAKPGSGYKQAGNSGGIPSTSQLVDHLHKSGSVRRTSVSWAFASPRISPSTSPPHLSPPRISELHKLPTPPLKSGNPTAYSAPLGMKSPEVSKTILPTSPLPQPPLALVKRCRSIPSSVNFAKNFHHTKASESSLSKGPLVSPPLKPIPWQESVQTLHVPTERN